MATTESSGPVNGNYAPQAYENSYSTGASNFTPSQQPTASQPAQQAAAEVPKDEVGWYFVEQYYTTLSKSPDRLYLFYNKRSQYVSGVEEEKVNVCVGQKAINERIKDLDYKDTKVRVTNVDSQGSDSNIVIQVIGEISNKGQPHKRFAQTFVLAEQTNGYFVLNDIFRYLAEEPEDDEEIQNDSANGVHEPSHTAAVPESAAIDQSNENATSEEDLHKVDEKLEEVAQEEPAVEETAPAAPTEQVPEEIEAPQTEEVPAAVSEQTPKEETPAADTSADVEKPKEPAPTPTASTPKAASVAMPSGPPKPAAPRTWASLAASAHKVATPVVAAPASQQVPTQPKAAASAQPAAATPASQTQAPARDQSPATSQTEATGWQTATGHKKEQSRAQNQTPPVDADQKRAYIKNVYSQVEEGALRAALTKYGEIEYLDISRGKNCAFVDFKTPAAFQAAIAANPHNVNGLDLKVEERRMRPEQQFRGGFPRGGAPRGRGGIGGQGPRGGFQPRGRGGPARGGRGAPQEA